MAKELESMAKRRGKTRSAVIRDALKHEFFRDHLEGARKILVPLARKQGIFTDEDVFKLVS